MESIKKNKYKKINLKKEEKIIKNNKSYFKKNNAVFLLFLFRIVDISEYLLADNGYSYI